MTPPTRRQTKALTIDGALIVGGGYAGVHAARELRRRRVPVTIIDPDGIHGFLPRLAAVAAGSVPMGDAWAPLERISGATVICDRALQVGDGWVEAAETGRIRAPVVLVTAGADPTRPDIVGLNRHALPLRTPTEALAIREHLHDAERLVVVGAGPTGTQLAAEAAHRHRRLSVSLIDQAERVLPQFDSLLGRHAETILAGRGVVVHLGTGIAEVTASGVELSDGSSCQGLTVWAGGYVGNGEALAGQAATSEGRLEVEPTLLVEGWKRTFAAGDVAAHRDRSGTLRPMSAQVAVQAGKGAGANMARALQGGRLRPVRLMDLGWVIDMGGGVGVAELGPVPLAAPLVDRLVPLLHQTIDLRNLAELGGLGALWRHAPGLHRGEPPKRPGRRRHLSSVA